MVRVRVSGRRRSRRHEPSNRDYDSDDVGVDVHSEEGSAAANNRRNNTSSPFQIVPSSSNHHTKETLCCVAESKKGVSSSSSSGIGGGGGDDGPPSSTASSSFASTFHQSINSAFSTDTPDTVPLAESSSASFSTTTCPGTETQKKSCETAWQILDRRNAAGNNKNQHHHHHIASTTSDGSSSLMGDSSWFNVSEQQQQQQEGAAFEMNGGYPPSFSPSQYHDPSRPARPSSANSIASITKKILHVAADATLMIKHQGARCMAHHEEQAYDDSEAMDIPLPLSSSNTRNRVSSKSSVTEATTTTTTSSTTTTTCSSFQKETPDKNSLEKTTTSNNDDIPLRQTYSLPLKKHDTTLDKAMKQMKIRRSTSTPAAFLQNRRGTSAFGRFASSPPSVHVNLSVSDPGISTKNKNQVVVESNTKSGGGGCTRADKKQRPVLELPGAGASLLNISNVDSESVASRELSTVSYEAQRRRRKQRQKRKQKEKKGAHPESKVVPEQVFAEFISNDGEKLDLRDTSEITSDVPDLMEEVSCIGAKSVYVPLKNDVNANDEDSEEFAGTAFLEEDRSAKPPPVESEITVPPPPYHQIIDDEPQTLQDTITMQPPRISQYPRRAPTPPQTPPSQRLVSNPRLSGVLQRKTVHAGSMSPGSYESCSYSRSTNRSGISSNTCNQTFSTSLSGTASCNRSITSSVAEADREVRDTNRRELHRREGFDVDGSMSIQSSDTTSTNPHAYLALVSSPAQQLRDGANMPVDRFFAGKHSSGSTTRRPPPPLNARSPITVSSNSLANTNSSASVSEDPPIFVSLSERQPAKTGAPQRSMPPRSRSSDRERVSSSGYSKLGSDGKIGRSSRSSSKSSSSRSSAKSRRKKKASEYIRIRSSPIPDRTPTSTPIPFCSLPPSPNTNQCTPLSSPNQFNSTLEQIDLPKPSARRPYQTHNQHHKSSINACVSPYDEEPRNSVSRMRSEPSQQWGFSELHSESSGNQVNGYTFVTPEKD